MSHQHLQSSHGNFSVALHATGVRANLSKLAIACGIASTIAFSGCQGIGFRGRDADFPIMTESDEDDWAAPVSPSSQVPRPRLLELRSKGTSAKNSLKPTASRYSQESEQNATPPQPSIVGYGASEREPNKPSTSETSSKDSKRASVMSTSEPDIDFEGALSSLPPEYRDKLRLQFEAVREKYQSSRIASADLNPAETENRSISDSSTAAPAPAIQASAAIAAETQAVSTAEPTTPTAQEKKSAVTIRLSDSIASDAKTAPAVSTAVAKVSSPPSLPTPAESQVVPASAVNSLPVNNLSASTSLPSLPGTTLAASATAPSANWRQNAAQAIESLEKQIAETPSTDESLRLSQELTLRMLYVAQRRLEDAVRPIDSLSESEQEFVRHQMVALFEASNPDAMPVRSRHWSLVMNSQREATNHLAAASNLEVKSVAFCTEVERYGVITKFPKTHFQADQEVLLYCEVDNVAAAKVRDGFETQLQGSYEIIDSQGRKIADQLLPMEPDICQNHRRDYFIVYKIYMPQQIATGNYQLKLTIEDMKAQKFGQGQVDFQIKK